jgi:hypothetical protein
MVLEICLTRVGQPSAGDPRDQADKRPDRQLATREGGRARRVVGFGHGPGLSQLTALVQARPQAELGWAKSQLVYFLHEPSKVQPPAGVVHARGEDLAQHAARQQREDQSLRTSSGLDRPSVDQAPRSRLTKQSATRLSAFSQAKVVKATS